MTCSGNGPMCACVLGAAADVDLVALEQYLASCVRRRDWHGVSDAANDIRVLEAKLEAKAAR